MKWAPRLFERQPLSIAPRAVLAGMLMLFLRSMAAETGAFADESQSDNWLKLNESGEPCEVTLADGTAVKLDTYGAEYDAYEYRPPLTGKKADQVVSDDRGPQTGWGDLAMDAKHQMIYWVEGTSKASRIMRARSNGAGAAPLMDFSDISPVHPIPDPMHGTLYWYTRGLPNGSERAIYRADLNGKNARPIIRDIADFHGFAVDPAGNNLYYFDGRRLIGTNLDGEGEIALLEAEGGPIAVDHDGGKIYWSNRRDRIHRANFDGSKVEDVVNTGSSRVSTIALDARNGLVYWNNYMPHYIRRARLDGTQIENVVVDILGFTDRIALDSERGSVLWMATDHKRRGRSVGLWRAKLPAIAKSIKKRAPPMIQNIMPSVVRSGDDAAISGTGFEVADQVVILDDGTGENQKARFTVRSDRELSIVVPRMSDRCRHPLVVVQNKGGITVTLPRSTTFAQRQGVDRFHPDDRFAYLVPADGKISIDRGVVLAVGPSIVSPAEHGKNTFFLKNGANLSFRRVPDNLVFLEPFASAAGIEESTGSRVVHVSAIRPSFLDSLPEYKENQMP